MTERRKEKVRKLKQDNEQRLATNKLFIGLLRQVEATWGRYRLSFLPFLP